MRITSLRQQIPGILHKKEMLMGPAGNMTGNIPGELGTAAEYLHLILDNFPYI
jgi:hypothetical protein